RVRRFRAVYGPTSCLRGSRRPGVVARRYLLLGVPRDRTLTGDPAALPRKSFILDRQRGTYLVRSGNDATFPHGFARDRRRGGLSIVLGRVRLGTTSIVPHGGPARRLAVCGVR